MKILLPVGVLVVVVGVVLWLRGSLPGHMTPRTFPPSLFQSSDAASRAPFQGTLASRAKTLETMPRNGAREPALRELALEWAAQSPTAAQNWAATLTNEADRNAALAYIAGVWADADPAAAVDMAQREHLPAAVLDNLIQQWGEKNFPAALAWVSNLPTGPNVDEALMRLAIARSEVDPAAAAALVTQRLSPGRMQEEAVMAVLYQWVRQDESAASAWVNRFPPGPFRARAEAEVKRFNLRRLSSAGHS